MKFETFSNGEEKKIKIKYIINNETIFIAHGVICDVFRSMKKKAETPFLFLNIFKRK